MKRRSFIQNIVLGTMLAVGVARLKFEECQPVTKHEWNYVALWDFDKQSGVYKKREIAIRM